MTFDEMPPCTDEEGLFASLGGKNLLVIDPDRKNPGYSFVTITNCGMATGIKRPVLHSEVPLAAKVVAEDVGIESPTIGKFHRWPGYCSGRNTWITESPDSVGGARAYGGTTYFIQAGDGGPIKIGTAGSAADRLKSLQCGNHETLRLLAEFPDDGKFAERKLHARFDEHRIAREWFVPHKDILNFVKEHNSCVSKKYK